MIYRIYSMYSHNKKVMVISIVAFIAEVTCNVTIYSLAARVGAKALKALPVVSSEHMFLSYGPEHTNSVGLMRVRRYSIVRHNQARDAAVFR